MFALSIFFNDTATTEIYTLSLHDALPIWRRCKLQRRNIWSRRSARCWRSSLPAPRRNRRRATEMLRPVFVLPLVAAGLMAQTVDRTKEPQTPPIPGYKLPPVFETKLPNGMGIVIVEDGRFPLVTVRLSVQAGSKFDPKDQPGLAEAVATVLTEGTKTRSARQISEETDSLGGSVGASAGADSMTIAGSALSDNISRLLVLMADVA